ncbi:hypothetical protein BRC68_05985 [Halobacteriales archaeon QH_6_64_20]|jgi:hypothetical protein|nr:MAG: hypothetical protein BRC68_05985 [Halobacteriales archaeon QH_6_64_20]
MERELTRRDALAALAASGLAAGVDTGAGGGAGSTAERETLSSREAASDETESPADSGADRSSPFTERETETLVSVAGTLYPSAVTGVSAFVETYTVGRVRDRPAYADGMKAALETLEQYATEWFDGRYSTLSTRDRGALLRQMGLVNADPDPAGSDPERLRYYLVNELLYALYSSPTGGELVGIENPPGHPGGLASYRRGPSSD